MMLSILDARLPVARSSSLEEDDLMRSFGSERIANVMDRMGAQQREVIYDMRLFALEGGEDLKGEVWEMIEHAAEEVIEEYAPSGVLSERWDLAGLRRRILLDQFVMVSRLPEENDPELDVDRHDVEQWVMDALKDAFHRKIESLGEHVEQVMSAIMLTVIDDKWKDHLYDLDHLKASISFRGWGQKDPLVEYKQEAYEMFVGLMTDLRKSVAQFFFKAQFGAPPPQRRAPQRLMYTGPQDTPGGVLAERAARLRPLGRQPGPAGPQAPAGPQQGVDEFGMARSARADGSAAVGGVAGLPPVSGPDPRQLSTNRGEDADRKQQPVHADKEPGRNDPCPCGSGKKYKKCHGR